MRRIIGGVFEGRSWAAACLAAALAAGVPGGPATAQLIPPPAAPAEQGVPLAFQPTLDRVRETKTFRIGYRHFAPPYSFTGPGDQPAGYIVDLCREVAGAVKRALNLPAMKTEYVMITAADRFEAVRDDRIDILCEPTSMTMSRRALVDFSLPTFIDGASVVTRQGTSVRGLEDLKSKKVGVLRGTTTEDTLKSSLAELRIPADIVLVNDHPDGLRQLADGKLDAYFGDRGILNYLIRSAGSAGKLTLSDQYFTFETYALGLQRGDQAFRLLVDSTLADLYRTERIRDIYARSFGTFPPDQFLNALFVINGVPR